MLGRPSGPACRAASTSWAAIPTTTSGHVLTLAIGHDTWIAAMPRDDRRVRLYSLNLDDEVLFGLDPIEPAPSQHWNDYPRGVAKVLGDERTRAGRVRRCAPRHRADRQRVELVGGSGMRDGDRLRGPRRLAARPRREGDALPARREPVRGGQLRHPRPVHVVPRAGGVCSAARLPRPHEPAGADCPGHPSRDLRHPREA